MGAAKVARPWVAAVVLAGLAGTASAARSQEGHPHQPSQPHGAPHEHPGGSHGNPADLDAYAAHLESAERAAWQKPDEVVAALGLKAGQTACDIGSGTGYFTLRLARAVGADGRVFAVDVEPRLLSLLAERVAAAGLVNVTPVLARPDDPLLPRAACDVVLIVDTYHHFPDGPAYLRGLRRVLAPGGRVVNIDFHKRDTPVGPPLAHRIAREDFLRDAESAGLAVASEETFLPHQYFLVLRTH
ncbi:MAG TPA: methyltransferase domain-containing protein [Vicinamibacteria bacterium]|nr:methyltransferase domain-containing protein [Vicinamibacteria bacterium]